MTTVHDLVFGHYSGVQDALREAGADLHRHATPESIAAAQRGIARAQEALAALSVALCDSEVPKAVDVTAEELS